MHETQSNRVDEFRQFKRGIRGSPEHLFVGTDIAKRKRHASLGDAKVTTHNAGLWQQRRLRHIWEAAEQSIGCRPGSAMALAAEWVVELL